MVSARGLLYNGPPGPIDAIRDVTQLDDIEVTLPAGGFKPSVAVGAVRESGLPEQFAELAPGPFGRTSTGVAVLEGLAEGVDLALCAGERLRGVMMEEAADGASLSLPELSEPQRQLVAAFETAVLADTTRRHVGDLCGLPDHQGTLDLEGLPELLARRQPEGDRLGRILRLASGWLEMKAESGELAGDSREVDDEAVAHAVAAFFGLLRDATVDYAERSELSALVEALENRRVRVAEHPYDGLRVRERTEDRSGLRPVAAAPGRCTGRTRSWAAQTRGGSPSCPTPGGGNRPGRRPRGRQSSPQRRGTGKPDESAGKHHHRRACPGTQRPGGPAPGPYRHPPEHEGGRCPAGGVGDNLAVSCQRKVCS